MPAFNENGLHDKPKCQMQRYLMTTRLEQSQRTRHLTRRSFILAKPISDCIGGMENFGVCHRFIAIPLELRHRNRSFFDEKVVHILVYIFLFIIMTVELEGKS